MPKPDPTPLEPEIAQPASPRSNALREHYARFQTQALTQGGLRTDGGGPDTRFTAADLARNFETIAFFNEYDRETLRLRGTKEPAQMTRWSVPMRINLQFSPTISSEQKTLDQRNISIYAQRLSAKSDHPVSITDRPSARNVLMLFMGADDQPFVTEQINSFAPGLDSATLRLLSDPPRTIHCLMLSFPAPRNPHETRKAIVLIRAELPDLLRKSCIHEELAQAMGLPNDDRSVRPSVFNDDDEFALLTTQDEMMLSMLYDRRLRAGMTLDTARPIIADLAQEKLGGGES